VPFLDHGNFSICSFVSYPQVNTGHATDTAASTRYRTLIVHKRPPGKYTKCTIRSESKCRMMIHVCSRVVQVHTGQNHDHIGSNNDLTQM